MRLELQEEKIDEIERLVAKEMAKLRVLGLSMAIIDEQGIVYQNGFGARNYEKNLEANIDTIYNIASLTKSMVCTAIMTLVDAGKLSVDDPANKYIPLKLGDKNKPITIKHLMNHTSGMPNLAGDAWSYRMKLAKLPIRKSAKYVPLSSKNDFYRLVNNGKEYYHEIDEYFHYNNYAYAMLGDIIETVSGYDDFTMYIKDKIFTPLKMESTSFNPDDFKDNDNLCIGYFTNEKDGNTWNVGRWNDRWEFLAAGGVYSTVKDLITYMRMHMNYGEYNGTRIISEEAAREMQQNSIKEGTLAHKQLCLNSLGENAGYGYGWFVNDNFYGQKKISHGGNMFGGTADFHFIPDLQIGLISLANNFIGPRPLLEALFADLMGVEHNSYMIEKEHFKSLNGIYEAYNEGPRIKVSGEVGMLVVQSTEESIFELKPTALLPLNNKELRPMEFFIRGAGGARFIVYFENIDDQIWFNFERNRYKRIGPL